MKMIKYFLIIFLVFGFFPLPTFSATNVDSLIKSSESTLYYYAADGKRYVFPNEKTYKSWFTDFSNVVELSDDELATIPLAGNVTYRPGIKMVKIQTDSKTYAVSRGGVLRWVQTEEIATVLYGSNWNTKIDDVPDTFFINYQIGDPIESADDYVRETEINSATTINDDKGLEKSGNPLVSDTSEIVAEEPEPIHEPAEEVVINWNNFRLTELEFRQKSPDIIVADDNYVAVWTDYVSGQQEDVRFALVNADGQLGSISFIASDNTYESTIPSVSRNDVGFGIVWEDQKILQREIYFMKIDLAGTKVTSETRVTNKIGFARNPKIVWNGTDYGVAWWDSRVFPETNYTQGALYYQKINTSDSLIGDNIRVTTTSSSAFDPDLIWGNDEYAVVWADDRDGQSEIYFVRFDDIGNILGTDDIKITETAEDSLNPSLVWDGSNYGVVWQEKIENVGSSGAHYEIYFQKINKSGEKVRDAIRLTTKDNGDSEMPKIILNNNKYGITWTDYRGHSDKLQSDVYFMEINSDGVVTVPEENVSNSESLSFEPSIASLNGEYVLIYTDNRHGEYEIYSAKRK